ncbi:hypothetical protein GOBAR_AA39353 [Gossypium barbadense]|uniref:Uncharacterized protein n=1 Tax=Gossypium barbadense TaxID=3634 RepID=A0A2P5VR92_GOSBA|nr:hypothetical protein GOBAR_AA39353 [Gossypium barbadense]
MSGDDGVAHREGWRSPPIKTIVLGHGHGAPSTRHFSRWPRIAHMFPRSMGGLTGVDPLMILGFAPNGQWSPCPPHGLTWDLFTQMS